MPSSTGGSHDQIHYPSSFTGRPFLWMSPALSGGGYSSEALAFAQGLAELLPNFHLRQFAEHADEKFVEGLPHTLEETIDKVHEEPNAARFAGTVVCHAPPDAWKPSKFSGWDVLAPCPPRGASHVVGRTMYETDSLPKDWVRRCNMMDSVWVPTAFHLETFKRAGVAAEKLAVVGEPVDGNFFDPSQYSPLSQGPLAPRTPYRTTQPYRFLAVFKWELRKGWDALLKAYLTEFTHDEPVELLLKTRPFHSSSDFEGLIREFAEQHQLPATRPRVTVLDSELPLRDLPKLYKAADAFVLPSRGEGWGRPHVEAMAMGLPVIATNWSGPTAYLDNTVGYPLKYTLQPVDASLNLPGHNWAEPDVDHLRKLMRRLVMRPEEGRAKGKRARELMLERFSPDVLAMDVLKVLSEVGSKKKDEL